EDGIRGRNVTGVQTCALPIWFVVDHEEAGLEVLFIGRSHGHTVLLELGNRLEVCWAGSAGGAVDLVLLLAQLADGPAHLDHPHEIGRASCREREKVSGRTDER